MSLALAVLLLSQAGEPAHAFVELAARPSSVFVEQPLRVTIRFGVEREYLRHNLLQLFTRPLDVPVQLELPWKADDTADAATLGPTFALGEEIVRPTRSGEETRDGRTWFVLELERGLVPETPGRLEIAAPVLHFAYATRFGEDLVNGSMPLDRQEGSVSCAPLSLEVAPFPAEGRPEGFADAVGKFTLALEVAPRELEAGDKLRIELTIAGQGNLARLAPPRLDGLPGLHLLGTTEELAGERRTLHCELVAESPRTREVPAIVLAYFDPEARAYGRASTAPVPLQVRARAPVGVGGAGFESRPATYLFYGVVLLAVAGIAAGVARLLRRR